MDERDRGSATEHRKAVSPGPHGGWALHAWAALWLSGCCLGAGVAPPEPPPEPPPTLPPDSLEPFGGSTATPPPLPPYTEPPSLLESPSVALELARAATGVPQRSDATQLFSRARPIEGAIHRGMLVCHAAIRGQYDDSLFAGGADVAMSLQLAGGETMGTGQRSSRTYTFPIGALEPGTTVSIGVVDMDVLFNDPIGNGATTYTGTPFEIEHPNARIECRGIASVEAQAQRALGRYQHALEAFETRTPDLLARDLGFPETRAVQEAAEDAASWIGWHDGDMEAGLRRAHQIDDAFAATIGPRVVEVLPTLPPAEEPRNVGDRTIRVARTICDDEARAVRTEMGESLAPGRSPACHVVLELEALRGTRLAGATYGAGEAWTLREDGRRERAERLATRCGDVWHRPDEPFSLERGERCEVHLGLSEPGAMLRVGGELARTPVLVRFE
ncbi:MAG: hypothetical protein U0353_29950 [Sandaracinus sp.]